MRGGDEAAPTEKKMTGTNQTDAANPRHIAAIRIAAAIPGSRVWIQEPTEGTRVRVYMPGNTGFVGVRHGEIGRTDAIDYYSMDGKSTRLYIRSASVDGLLRAAKVVGNDTTMLLLA